MEKAVDLQGVVKHIVNGSFSDSLCRICLLPLGDCHENLFTKVCKEDKEYCIADVLALVCQIKIAYPDRYNVCSDCFYAASSAYKFYLMSKRSEEILECYVDELTKYISPIEIPEDCAADSICITMPILKPQTEIYDYALTGIGSECFEDLHDVESQDSDVNTGTDSERYVNVEKDILAPATTAVKVEGEGSSQSEPLIDNKSLDDDDDIVIIMQEDGEPSFFKAYGDGSVVSLPESETKRLSEVFKQSNAVSNVKGNAKSENTDKVGTKRRRKRDPMDYKSCSRCPIKYRFVAKLKEHMKTDHNVDIFVCKVCKAIIEDEEEFNLHLKTHTNIHRCAICNAMFKKRETIIAHFRSHEEMRNRSKLKSAHVCEVCGEILKDEENLKDHIDKKHSKKYTCFYCGRRYKGEISFERHIKEHEMHIDGNKKSTEAAGGGVAGGGAGGGAARGRRAKGKVRCQTCGRDFVDERSLMWHERLHNNERPYVCDVCGRAFVSQNRCRQHAACAHAAPARRCPLCPALFHLRSMVNTHIRKVHLKKQKRRNRSNRHQNVFWRTETVPFQDLSVPIQNEILELKTAQENQQWTELMQYDTTSTRTSNTNGENELLTTYCIVKTDTEPLLGVPDVGVMLYK